MIIARSIICPLVGCDAKPGSGLHHTIRCDEATAALAERDAETRQHAFREGRIAATKDAAKLFRSLIRHSTDGFVQLESVAAQLDSMAKALES